MIETGQELIDGYSASFRADGGDPDACIGFVWLKEFVENNTLASVDDVVQNIGRKINERTADHGWLIGILKYCWGDLPEAQRLNIFGQLKAGGALKVLMNRDVFPSPTDNEKAFLIQAFQESRSVAALRRLNG